MRKILNKYMGESWAEHLEEEFSKDYMKETTEMLKVRRKYFEVYPSSEDVFRALRLTPLQDVKVVIIGQDPYHTPNMATGLCFAVPSSTPLFKLPPSLKNIIEELKKEYGASYTINPNLKHWAEQGVLLLNTSLTVERGKPNIHSKYWKPFTRRIIEVLNKERKNVVYLLWGGHAKDYSKFLDKENNCILTTGHPSPLSANKGLWFGNNHFLLTNTYLKDHNLKQIKW